MTFIIFAVISAASLWALLGLGWLCCRAFGYRAATWAETIGIGLAGLIAAGGALNLCRISYGPVYDCLLAAGMLAAFRVERRAPAGTFEVVRSWYPVVLAALMAGVLWLIGHAQLPPSAFNYQDDFQKYLVHPLRMLQTGTLFGSPLSAIGAETLGGQAVLQGIAAYHVAVPYLFAVDALFALLLCLLLVATAVPHGPGRLFSALLSLAAVCFVNPMVINVSATYTTCALFMTVLLVCRSLYLGESQCRWASTLPLLLGLLFAGLLALKTINLLYLLTVSMIAAVLSLTLRAKGREQSGKEIGLCATCGATLLFILPWLLIHAPHYLAISSGTIDGARFAAAEAPYREPLDLLSFTPLFYGSSYAHYTLLLLIVVLYCAGLYFLSSRQSTERPAARAWLLSCAVALPVTAVLILALGPQLNGYFANIRYTTPLLIAGSAMLLPLAAGEAVRTAGRAGIAWSIGLAACGLCAAGLFAEGFISRVQQASSFGNSLAFSKLAGDPDYLAYNREVLFGSNAGRMRRIQGVIPAGASVLAWVSTPYQLDFTRNLIYDVDQAGVGNPWARIPRADYVMYQYAGYAVPSVDVIYEDLRHPGRRERQVGRNALALIEAMNSLTNSSQELYNDGEIAVVKVAASGGRP